MMRTLFLFSLLVLVTLPVHAQLIVDHRAVDEFDSIPAAYLTEVKKMMVAFPGESHSEAMRYGMKLLEGIDPVPSRTGAPRDPGGRARS